MGSPPPLASDPPPSVMTTLVAVGVASDGGAMYDVDATQKAMTINEI